MALSIELLDKSQHNSRAFDCSKDNMNVFIRQFAVKNQKLGISRTWVFADSGSSKKEIAAYFTLAMQTVEPSDLHSNEKLPNYPTSVVLLARIAVDKRFQGQGLGKRALLAALAKALQASEQGLPAFAVVLDVLDDDALKFYQSFDFFQHFGDETHKLFVPMKAVKQLFQVA
ncbi:GNAT family N-acetyltransferase [Kingella kingae]|uniref:GNAT family N-acetyltransferase n=1 Tax=Kingella kingae TaxID=504 RepID=UPI0002F44911|nr:GNAT family N-acetyltransferase [Kingella kingae]MDK4556080.1 GNAT family N-acetyltransferase [Kingella kingae]MDK4585138.1 GNAT family N-acetyltransferase [Kingella kingae]MDK4589144.1 GNAT family N-acetyltransferase [Kingella kingae]MDK4597374.1 GNAT family N-acetyltransferase [Kingella kingae]MDK4601320.1 GNAT family N-acetyltransferase [Kingella kingae]